MENLIIEGTGSLPKVNFYANGNLSMEGRLLPDNAVKAFEPLFNWINGFSYVKVRFSINLEYLNTSSSMQLFSLLKILEGNCEIQDIQVIWHYDEDDEDHLETGQIFAEQLRRTKFSYETELAA